MLASATHDICGLFLGPLGAASALYAYIAAACGGLFRQPFQAVGGRVDEQMGLATGGWGAAAMGDGGWETIFWQHPLDS